MATTKQAGPAKAIAKANEAALKKFPKARLVKAMTAISEAGNANDEIAEAKQAAAYDVVEAARTFRSDNAEATTETVVIGWRDHVKAVAMELALAGNRFAELTPAKDDNPATAKLTGYGANVVSIAKGAIEFEAEGDTYREVRKAVEAARAEARRNADPDAALIADAKAEAVDSWDALRKAVFESGDLGLIAALAETLDDMLAQFHAQQAEADAIEAEAEGEAEPEVVNG